MDASERARLRRWADPDVVRQDAELFTPNDVVPLLDALDAAEARETRLREALEWYGDSTHYHYGAPGHEGVSTIYPEGERVWIKDGGDRARAALAVMTTEARDGRE